MRLAQGYNFLVLFCFLIFSSEAKADSQFLESCLFNIDKAVASAGFFSNARGAEDSLKVKSRQLLARAMEGYEQAKKPKACNLKCKDGCEPKVVVNFEVIPKSFLEDYSDKEECEKLYTQTKASPFEYSNLKFSGTEELSNWFSDFSQGKGKEGRDLYNRCTGTCSPQYKVFVEKSEQSGLDVQTKVVCAYARDKSEDLYDLFISYNWSCSCNYQ